METFFLEEKKSVHQRHFFVEGSERQMKKKLSENIFFHNFLLIEYCVNNLLWRISGQAA
jgi:hypothetical protein